ncbi:MAG: SusD/RagB family nutrient-binding outer membrane lipoprotein, partial [Duncaniella sp.]|nr:SusD/RagB family nutrient-binding outer membrane lipoprotein [Duncaniella sp.]
MRRNKYSILIAALAFAATACTDNFENINSNPYEPGDLTADDYALGSQLNNVASCVMSSDVNTLQFTDALLGGTLGGYYSDANAGFAESFARYNAKNDWSR